MRQRRSIRVGRDAAGALALAAAAFAMYWPGLDGRVRHVSDYEDYARIAFNLVHHRTFHGAIDLAPGRAAAGPASSQPGGRAAPPDRGADPAFPYVRREPGFPWFFAAVLATSADGRALSLTCLSAPACETAAPTRRRVQRATVIVTAVIAAATLAAIRTVTGSGILAAAGGLLGLLLLPRDPPSLLAAGFLLAHAVLAAAAWRRPRIRTGVLSGLALGLLALTKAAFQYWLAGVAVCWLAAVWRDPGRRRATLPAFAALCATAWAVTLPWMVRNAVHANQFGISGRSGEVLAIRAEYGRMTWSELRGAFAYYLPHDVRGLRTSALRWLEPARFGYARFDRGNPQGFYRRTKNGAGEVAAQADRIAPGWRHGPPAVRDEALGQAAGGMIRNDWPKQVLLTAAFALRGSAIRRPVREDVDRMAAAWGASIGAAARILIRVAETASLLFLPALGLVAAAARRRRDAALGFLILPVLQGIVLHAAATHFIPRYAWPFAPAAAVVIMLAWQETGRLGTSLRNTHAADALHLDPPPR